MQTENQSRAIDFLSRPATYGTPGPVERIETHISIIFLAGTKAYKMKKALRLPYLDFSTAPIREAACREEVRLNSETAPSLYIGLRRITEAEDGGLELDGRGRLVEAVVEMVRFDQQQLFDRIAMAGKLTPALLTATARMIAAYHAKAPVVSTGGGAANILAVLDINKAGFAVSHVFDPAAVARLDAMVRKKLERYSVLLDRRAHDGMVRRCHGDLHLRNICLLDGTPRLFDCIEFNAQIAIIDVLYDLAFLLMDLWHRDLVEFANLVMNRYFDQAGNEEGFCLLPFFMAIRAAVRAHVTATQAEEPGQDIARLSKEARSYFDMAETFLEDYPPRLIAIGGLSGSGKSTVADRLAPKLGAAPGARILESDRIRKGLYGVPAETRLPAEAYTPDISTQVYREMACRAETILGQGGTVVANAVFARPEDRLLIGSVRNRAPFQGIWLDAAPALLNRRIEARRASASDADANILAQQLRAGLGDISWRRIDASIPADTVAELIKDAPA